MSSPRQLISCKMQWREVMWSDWKEGMKRLIGTQWRWRRRGSGESKGKERRRRRIKELSCSLSKGRLKEGDECWKDGVQIGRVYSWPWVCLPPCTPWDSKHPATRKSRVLCLRESEWVSATESEWVSEWVSECGCAVGINEDPRRRAVLSIAECRGFSCVLFMWMIDSKWEPFFLRCKQNVLPIKY